MTTYRCAACNKDVEAEKIYLVDVIEITPCEVCLNAAEKAVKEESHDEGYQEGWQDAESLAEEKAEEEEEYGEDTSILLQNEEEKSREEIVEAKSEGFRIDLKLRR